MSLSSSRLKLLRTGQHASLWLLPAAKHSLSLTHSKHCQCYILLSVVLLCHLFVCQHYLWCSVDPSPFAQPSSGIFYMAHTLKTLPHQYLDRSSLLGWDINSNCLHLHALKPVDIALRNCSLIRSQSIVQCDLMEISCRTRISVDGDQSVL